MHPVMPITFVVFNKMNTVHIPSALSYILQTYKLQLCVFRDSCTHYFPKQWIYRDPTFSLCQTVADGTGVDSVIV